jgi:MYXO-CTERM domain-containing protein
MRKGLVACAAVAAVLSIVSSSHGYTFDQVIVEEWVGGGSNEAMMVVDFGSGHSYAWGYRWDGSATGLDMITDVDDATGLVVHTTDFGWGIFVDDMSYDGHTMGLGDYYCGYFVSDDGESWSSSSVGISDRSLADGCWDGWSEGYWKDENDNYPPGDPVTPIPEPATLALAGLGGIAAVRRRRGS